MRIPLFLYFLSLLFVGVVQMFRLIGWRNLPVQAQAFGTELWHFAGFFMENIPKRSFLGGRNLHPRTAILHLILHLKMPGNKGGFHDGCRNVGFFTKTYFGEG